jgi:eukaryotic-like serine/threonine-protein kinase
LWSDFESDIVEGRYTLGKLLRSEGRCGWFETRFKEKPAIISVIESLNDESMLLERLRAVERIKDRNVVAIFETGATIVRDTPLVYALIEYTEENLEDVLRTRALSADETRQVADGLLNALRAIHKERLVCGRLEAASVLALGDTIKLRSDHLQLIPKEDAAFNSHAGKDIRDFGSLLYQCLTQKPLKRAADGNDPALQLLPPPFVQVVRRTLSGNATLYEIAAILRPGAGLVPAAPVESRRVAHPIPKIEPKVEARPAAKPEDRKAPEPVVETPSPESAPSKRTPLILSAVIALLLLLGFALWSMLHHSNRSQDPATQNPVVVVSPETTTPRKTPAAVPASPQKAAPSAPVSASAVPSPARKIVPDGEWRVVAFTYNHQEQAEHKVRTINDQHPDLEASVFSPKGSGAPFLVTLGPATDRASAFRLRNKAVAEGLPKDTYAQNYSH